MAPFAAVATRKPGHDAGKILIGKILHKRYVILEQTGSDGGGTVFSAYDMNRLKRVRVKVGVDGQGELDPANFEVLKGAETATTTMGPAPGRPEPPDPNKPAPNPGADPASPVGGIANQTLNFTKKNKVVKPDEHSVKTTQFARPNLSQRDAGPGPARTANTAGIASSSSARDEASAGKPRSPLSAALPGDTVTKSTTATRPLFSPLLAALGSELEDDDGRSDTIKVDYIPDMEPEAEDAQAPPEPSPVAALVADSVVKAAKASPGRKKRKTRPPGKRKPKKRKVTQRQAKAGGKKPTNGKPRARRKKKTTGRAAPLPLTRAKPAPLEVVPEAAKGNGAKGDKLSRALEDALSKPAKGRADPTQQLDLDEMEELVVEPSAAAARQAKGRPETRKIEAAWFAEGAGFDEESPPDEPPQPGTGDPQQLWSKADEISADKYRQFSLDLSPPKPPPGQASPPPQAGPMVTAVSGEIASSAGPGDGPAISPGPLVRVEAESPAAPAASPFTSDGAPAAAVAGAVDLPSAALPPVPEPSAPPPSLPNLSVPPPSPLNLSAPPPSPPDLSAPPLPLPSVPKVAESPPMEDPPGLVTRDIIPPAVLPPDPVEEPELLPMSYPTVLRHPAARWLTGTRKGTFVLGIVVGTLVTTLCTCIF